MSKFSHSWSAVNTEPTICKGGSGEGGIGHGGVGGGVGEASVEQNAEGQGRVRSCFLYSGVGSWEPLTFTMGRV